MKKILSILVLLIPTGVLYLVLKFGIDYVIANSTDPTKIGSNIQQAIPFLLILNHTALAGLIFCLMKKQEIRFTDFGLSKFWKMSLFGVGIGALLFSIQFLVTLPALESFKLFTYWSGFPGFPTLISATIFAGFVEEIIFRGYGSTILLRYGFNKKLTLVVTTLAFVMLHYGQGWAGLINAAIMGGVLGALYLKIKSLPLVISGHLFANLFFLMYMTFS